MGKRRWKANKAPKVAPPKANPDIPGAGYVSFGDLVKTNALMEKYYQSQSVIPASEWDEYLAAARRELPLTFRLGGCKKEAIKIRQLLMDKYLSKMNDLEIEGERIEPAKELSWYPDGFGFQLSLPRRVVRKNELFTNLQNFLVTETEQGNVSRQEAVSMIPPLFMDVTSSSKVLDMCAAPGSKTAQLIEMLHADESIPIPSGFVIANDSDNRRCHLLCHQSLKRIFSACCMVINHDASQLPNIFQTQADGSSKPLKFDRILCDVPCSGDGTTRKNYDVWKKWSPANANALHRVQCAILKRGLELLEVEGVLVYSTCSLNPVENEAVLKEALRYFGAETVELVDVSDKLPSLKRVPGIFRWKVMDKRGALYDCYADVPTELHFELSESLFSPTDEELAALHLDRCFRILPHHQDTGGFFVAVLRKLRSNRQRETTTADATAESASLLPEANGSSASAKSTTTKPIMAPPKKRQKFAGGASGTDDPFTFMDDNVLWSQIKTRFGISDDFPRRQLFARCSDERNSDEAKRMISFVSPQLRDILTHNSERIKVINAGVRMFGKADSKQEFRVRLTQDSIGVLVPYLSKRVVEIPKEDLVQILAAKHGCGFSFLSSALQAKLQGLDEGSVACCCHYDGLKLCVSVWMGKSTLTPYISREARVHHLRLLDYDTHELELQMKRQFGPEKSKQSNSNAAAGESTLEEDAKNGIDCQLASNELT